MRLQVCGLASPSSADNSLTLVENFPTVDVRFPPSLPGRPRGGAGAGHVVHLAPTTSRTLGDGSADLARRRSQLFTRSRVAPTMGFTSWRHNQTVLEMGIHISATSASLYAKVRTRGTGSSDVSVIVSARTMRARIVKERARQDPGQTRRRPDRLGIAKERAALIERLLHRTPALPPARRCTGLICRPSGYDQGVHRVVCPGRKLHGHWREMHDEGDGQDPTDAESPATRSATSSAGALGEMTRTAKAKGKKRY